MCCHHKVALKFYWTAHKRGGKNSDMVQISLWQFYWWLPVMWSKTLDLVQVPLWEVSITCILDSEGNPVWRIRQVPSHQLHWHACEWLVTACILVYIYIRQKLVPTGSELSLLREMCQEWKQEGNIMQNIFTFNFLWSGQGLICITLPKDFRSDFHICAVIIDCFKFLLNGPQTWWQELRHGLNILVALLLVIAGDVELNPGPSASSSMGSVNNLYTGIRRESIHLNMSNKV